MLHANLRMLPSILTPQNYYCTYNYSLTGAGLDLPIEAACKWLGRRSVHPGIYREAAFDLL